MSGESKFSYRKQSTCALHHKYFSSVIAADVVNFGRIESAMNFFLKFCIVRGMLREWANIRPGFHKAQCGLWSPNKQEFFRITNTILKGFDPRKGSVSGNSPDLSNDTQYS
jgi:hypothetical protein